MKNKNDNDTAKIILTHCKAMAQTTGGPPLTQKSQTLFPLTQFLAYVRASGNFRGSRGL